jgi:hypothetical protein
MRREDLGMIPRSLIQEQANPLTGISLPTNDE